SFAQLDQYNQAGLKSILETAASKPQVAGSIEQKVGDFFASAMDTAAIDAAGTKPVASDLEQIAAMGNLTDLTHTLALLHNQGVSGMFAVSVSADQKRSDINALYALQGGLSLPSKDYYVEEKHDKVRDGFVVHVAKIFELAGDTPEAAAAGAKLI